MDKLAQLKTALDEILADDRVTLQPDGTYRVAPATGGVIRVGRASDGDWTATFEDGRTVPFAPRHARPNEVVAWALS